MAKTSRCSLVLCSHLCRFNQILPNKTTKKNKTWTNEFLLSSDFLWNYGFGEPTVLGIPIKDCKAATPSISTRTVVPCWMVSFVVSSTRSWQSSSNFLGEMTSGMTVKATRFQETTSRNGRFIVSNRRHMSRTWWMYPNQQHVVV